MTTTRPLLPNVLAAVLAGLLVAGPAVALSACAGSDDDSPMAGMHSAMAGARTSPGPGSAGSSGSSGSSGSVDPRHNSTDVAFDHMMIVHHRMAVEMADLAPERAGRDVRELAAGIRTAQTREIAEMRAWLAAWGQPAMMGAAGGVMGGHLMSSGELADLREASGAEFDHLFLELMIPHHEDAIAMARAEEASGINPQTLALARSIVVTQTAEIARMRAMLAG